MLLPGVVLFQVDELRDFCQRLVFLPGWRSYELRDRLAGILARHGQGPLMDKVGGGGR